jgi:hypothetical protein
MMPFSPAALQVMSHDSVAFEAIENPQPVVPREHVSPSPELHPRLCEQLAQARLAAAGSLELAQLLPLISSYYELLDDERRRSGWRRCRTPAGDPRSHQGRCHHGRGRRLDQDLQSDR